MIEKFDDTQEGESIDMSIDMLEKIFGRDVEIETIKTNNRGETSRGLDIRGQFVQMFNDGIVEFDTENGETKFYRLSNISAIKDLASKNIWSKNGYLHSF